MSRDRLKRRNFATDPRRTGLPGSLLDSLNLERRCCTSLPVIDQNGTRHLLPSIMCFCWFRDNSLPVSTWNSGYIFECILCPAPARHALAASLPANSQRSQIFWKVKTASTSQLLSVYECLAQNEKIMTDPKCPRTGNPISPWFTCTKSSRARSAS